MMAENNSQPVTPRKQQQEYYQFFGHADRIIWDLYDLNDGRKFLEMKVGFALFGPPQALPDQQTADASGTAIPHADHHTGYNPKQVEVITLICNQIISENKYAVDPKKLYMSILFTICAMEENNAVPTAFPVQDRTDLKIYTYPVFRVRKCVDNTSDEGGHMKCKIFIDHESRVYTSWSHYLTKNRIPQGILITPKDGIYNAHIEDGREKVLLEERHSPACSLTNVFLSYADRAGMVTAIGATAVGLATAIPVIPVAAPVAAASAVAGGTSGIYSVFRSAFSLVDRSQHSQSISLADREARGHWLGVAGGSTGILAGGTTSIFRSLVGQGVEIGANGQNLVNLMNGAAIAMNGVGTAYGIYQIFDLYYNENETPSPLMLFQVSASIFFFTHSVVSMKTADTIMRETQEGAINEFSNNLRSNRHRRRFNAMRRETVRIAGDEVAGNRDVIRSMNRIENVDDFFAGAVRISKGMNHKNVRLSFAPDGTALLNNAEKIDPMQFWASGKEAQMTTFERLPPIPKGSVTRSQMAKTESSITKILNLNVKGEIVSRLIAGLIHTSQNGEHNNTKQIFSYYLSSFSEAAVESLMKFFLDFLENTEVVMHQNLEMVAPDVDRAQYIFNFLYTQLSRMTYNAIVQNGMQQEEFTTVMEQIIRSLFIEGRLNEHILNTLMSDLYDYLEISLRHLQEQEQRDSQRRITCSVCNGFYYNN